MTESKKSNDEYDIFIANSIYPEAAPIFTFKPKSLQEIKDTCYIVIDTNILLIPYTLYRGDLLEQCRSIYSSLISENRLIIPGQVAREFAENRANKLSELHQKFSQKREIKTIHEGRYPLLNGIGEYEAALNLENEIDKKIRDYKKVVNGIIEQIEQWTWDDPVNLLYNTLFTEEVVLDLQINEEQIRQDLEKRQLYKIPPGYKDAAKENRGVGDLLIWYTILEIGEKKEADIIFISNDAKPDWFKQSQKSSLHLRYELTDEFRRKSKGQTLHVIKFSRFLELYGASQALIEEIKEEEKAEKAGIVEVDNKAIFHMEETDENILGKITKNLVLIRGYLKVYDEIRSVTHKKLIEAINQTLPNDALQLSANCAEEIADILMISAILDKITGKSLLNSYTEMPENITKALNLIENFLGIQ